MTAPKVLVVDDHPTILKPISKLLEMKGYVVATASDGEEAINVFRTFQPHAMILDVMLPKQNGYRISRMIKTLGKLGDGVAIPKIILITARHVEDAEREESLLSFSMADDILYKPFRLDDLLDRLRTVLGIRGAPLPAETERV